MIIDGPVGVMPNAKSASKHQAFICVENGSTVALTAGQNTMWDETDNTAVAGILQNTRGLRIFLCSATATVSRERSAGLCHKDTALTTAGTRGPTVLLQCWGFRAGVLVDNPASLDVTVGGMLQPSTVTAGKVMGPTTAAITAPEAARKIGINVSTTTVAQSTTGTIEAFIKCI